MPSQSQHSVRGRSADPRRDRRYEAPRTPERPPMTYPKSAPPLAPSSGRHGEAGGPGTAGAYQRRREGEYGRHGERKDKTRHEKKRKHRSTKDKADHAGRHDKKKAKKEPAEKAKEKQKEKAVPAKDKPASSGDDDSSSSSSEDSKETVIEEAPKVPEDPKVPAAAAEGSGNQIMVSAISSRMDEMTAVAMSFSRSLVRAQQALRTSARIARDAAMGFESEMENFSRAEKEINETFGLKFDTEEK